MKKFKKSLVILPALATMALTTVASVTGTVAWFTANRTVSVTGSQFETITENSTLNVTLTAGQGTTIQGKAVTVGGKLTHGSYNAVANHTGSAYVANLEGTTVLSYSDKGAYTPSGTTEGNETSATAWKSPASTSNDNIWYAVGWKMNFTYDGVAATGAENHLLFDINGCTWTDSTTDGATIQGLRIAFMTSANNGKVLVIGGNTGTGTDNTEIKYVKGTSTSDTDKYTVGTNYQVYSNATAKATDGYTENDYKLYDFGKIEKDSFVDVYCVAWYEGEDTSVVDTNSDKLSSVAATLPWYVRSTKA